MTFGSFLATMPFIVLGFRALLFVSKQFDKPDAPPPKRSPKNGSGTNPRRSVARVVQPPPPAPPQRVVSLVGRASAGKSSLANALIGQEAFAVGVEHGTTTEVLITDFRAGYQLYDTPGLLDGETYNRVVLDAARDSELVILLTTGQLYRQEVDFLRELCTFQSTWNRTRDTLPARTTVVFLNACDLKERTMPSTERAQEIAALKAQVRPWLSAETVLTGAASPLEGGAPWISSLEGYLAHFFQQASVST